MSEREDKIGRLLGLCRRSGQLALGVAQVEKALRSGRARLVLLASDGSFGQRKGAFGLSRRHNVPVHEGFPAGRLAAWVGTDRLTALAVTDPELARGIAALIEGSAAAQAEG